MKLKKLFYTFLGIYGAAKLIEEHGNDVAKWLEKKAAELGRKAGEKYTYYDPMDNILKFKRIWHDLNLNPGDHYYILIGAPGRADLLVYTYGNEEDDRLNFAKYECYILVEE